MLASQSVFICEDDHILLDFLSGEFAISGQTWTWNILWFLFSFKSNFSDELYLKTSYYK